MISASEREGVRQAPFTRRANGHTIIFNGGDPADEAIRLASFDWLTLQRLHQSAFYELGIAAYDKHCALCSLRHRELLDTAGIVADADDRGIRWYGTACRCARSTVRHAIRASSA